MDPRRIRPVGARLLVRCEPRPEKSSGGIVLPAEFTAMEKVDVRAGEVMRKGSPRDLSVLPKKSPMRELQARLAEVEIGSRVVFRSFLADANDLTKQGNITDDEGSTWTIIDVRDIIGVAGKDLKVGELGVVARR